MTNNLILKHFDWW